LVRQSFQVLKLDKELLVFPLLSGIACLLVLASFALPLWAAGAPDVLAEKAEGGKTSEILLWVLLFVYYAVNYFVIFFFNSALIACAIIRFKGGDPTLADGFSAATARLPQILCWALVAATVGLILRMIESRSERVGQFVAGLLGMAWSAVTYFVVPVIVVEKVGPIEATKRSTAILKRAWGESLTANFGIGAIVFVATLVGVIPIVAGGAALAAGHAVLGIAGIAFGLVLVLIVSLISATMHAIIVAALYLYAAEGVVADQFDRGLFDSAFAQK